MNMIYGIASTEKENGQFQFMSERLEKLYNINTQKLSNNSQTIQCGYISDGGSILGCATHNNISLLYLGAIQKPLSNWDKGSPLDDPDYTAKYLLLRYQDMGLNFLDQVFGQYILVVCDYNKSSLILSCDPSGLHRVFYFETAKTLIFGSKLIAVGCSLGDKLVIDRSLEDFLLSYVFLPWNKTLYKGVKSLANGFILEWIDGHSNTHSVQKRDPWKNRFSNIDFDSSTEKEVIDTLYEAFMLALEEQSPSSYHTPVILGGFDSALVASALKRLGKKVETYSFDFGSQRFNQRHTDTLASYLKIRHNWIPISIGIIRDGLLNFSCKFNQVSARPHYLIQTELICSIIRNKGYYYIFSGDGCDGIFLGYPRVYFVAKVLRSLGILQPKYLKLLLKIIQWPGFERYLGHLYRIVRNHLIVLGKKMPERGYITSRILDEQSLSRLRLEPAPIQERNVEDILKMLASSFKDVNPIRLAYLGRAAPGVNKNKIGGSSESTGTIINSPYLHQGMINLARQLPEKFCRPQKKNPSSVTGKYILMKMAEQKGLLPKDIIYQKKQSPIDSCIDNWYSGPLRSFMIDLMKNLPFKYSERYIKDILRPKLAENFYREFLTMDHYAYHAIALLATYASITKFSKKKG